MKKGGFLKVLLVLILWSLTLCAWDITKVDVGVKFGDLSSRSIAVDSSGFIHGVYGGRQLYHKVGSQSAEVVDDTIGVGEGASIAIDNNDELYIAYTTDNQTLKCAIGSSGNYEISTIDTGVALAQFSIDVNSSNVVHLSYIKSNTLKHAWFDGSWHDETLVNSNVQETTSLVIDSSDNIHIAYGDLYALKYTAKIAGTWVYHDIDASSNATHAFSSIAVDTNGAVYVAYLDSSANTFKLMLAKKHGFSNGEWNSTLLRSSANTTGWSPSLAIAGTKCYVSFGESDGIHYNTKYVTYDGTNTDLHTVNDNTGLHSALALSYGAPVVLYNVGSSLIRLSDSSISDYANESDMGKYTAVATDGNGYLHVSYVDAISSALRYATNAPSGNWNRQTVNATAHVHQTSIAVDSNNKAHICYYDSVAKDLKYVTSAESWQINTLDETGDVGDFCDIALDSSEHVHISYYDRTNGDLKYVTNASGSWQSETVESIGNVGEYSAIALNSDGNVTISYMQNTGTARYFYYVKGTYGNWSLPFNPDNASALYNSIAIDDLGALHGAYYVDGGADLKYIENSTGSWSYKTFSDSATVSGKYTSLAINDTQNAFIAYYDETNKDAKFSTNVSGIWTTESIATFGRVGEYTSLALSDNIAHVCYYNADHQSLECASKTFDKTYNALSSFYYATNGDQWIDSTNWLSGDKCNWYGIGCDVNENVYSISLSDNNLTGALPKEIADLNNTLTTLVLKGNNINDISSVANLKLLKGIDIRNNHISDISALSQLGNLLELYLSDNPIGSLDAIKDLGVTYIFADNIGLTALPQFTDMHLNVLSLNGNRLTNLTGMEGLASVGSLYVQTNELTDISALSSMTSLREVDFIFNRELSDISPLNNSKSIHYLDVGYTRVSDISSLINFPDLRTFYAGKFVTVSDLTPLAGLTKMEDLSLWLNNDVSNLSALSGMTKMKDLFISGGNFKDLAFLNSMHEIEKLTLRCSSLRNISPLKNLTTLKELNISCNYVRDISALSFLTLLNYVHLEYNCIRDFSPVAHVDHVYGSDQRDPKECMGFIPAIINYLLN